MLSHLLLPAHQVDASCSKLELLHFSSSRKHWSKTATMMVVVVALQITTR
jgi:hypothetical protein